MKSVRYFNFTQAGRVKGKLNEQFDGAFCGRLISFDKGNIGGGQ